MSTYYASAGLPDPDLNKTHDESDDINRSYISAGLMDGFVNMYYSVGEQDDNNRIASNVSLTDGVGTFSVAQTGNIGVGDVMDYDVDNKLAFIIAKISTTQWLFRTATGAIPGDVATKTVNTIKRAFGSWNDAMDGANPGAGDANHLNTKDLVTADIVLYIALYRDKINTVSIDINGWTTDAGRKIINYSPSDTVNEVNTVQRHDGCWCNGGYSLSTIDSDGIDIINTAYVDFVGIRFELKITGAASRNCMDAATLGAVSNAIVIDKCLFKEHDDSSNTGSSRGINPTSANFIMYIRNCIFQNFRNGSGLGIRMNVGADLWVYNCLAYNCDIGFEGNSNQFTAKNLATQICTNGYNGTFHANSDNNLSDLAGDAPGTNPHNSKSIVFVNTVAEDFRLKITDTSALEEGVDLSGDADMPFDDDIIGTSRPQDSLWDIGPFEGAIDGAHPILHYRQLSIVN